MSRGKADWRIAWVSSDRQLHIGPTSWDEEQTDFQKTQDFWIGSINLATRPVVLPAACVKAMRGSK